MSRIGVLVPQNTDTCDEWPTGRTGIETRTVHHEGHSHSSPWLMEQWAIRLSAPGEQLRFYTEWREVPNVTHLIPKHDQGAPAIPVRVLPEPSTTAGLRRPERVGMSPGTARQELHDACVETASIAGDADFEVVDQCVETLLDAIEAWKHKACGDG